MNKAWHYYLESATVKLRKHTECIDLKDGFLPYHRVFIGFKFHAGPRVNTNEKDF